MPRSSPPPPPSPALSVVSRAAARRFRAARQSATAFVAILVVAAGAFVGPLAAAGANVGADLGTGAREPPFAWPLSPEPTVTRPFDAPDGRYGPGHRGADLAAASHQAVLAAGDGVVVFAGPVAGRGVISIDHHGGLRTTYEPVSPVVSAGQYVHRGQRVGTVAAGHTGCPQQACLHWGVRRGEEYLDPLPLVRVDTVLRLKPWEAEP